jgi:DNA adenine methylase
VGVLTTARAFRQRSLEVSDFEPILDTAESGDVIYADPPYTTKGENNGFVRYNEKLFAWADQMRLARSAKRAARRGAFVCVSGLWHEDLLALYPRWWALKLPRKSLVSRVAEARRDISEVALFSHKPAVPPSYALALTRVK